MGQSPRFGQGLSHSLALVLECEETLIRFNIAHGVRVEEQTQRLEGMQGLRQSTLEITLESERESEGSFGSMVTL